MNKINIQIDIDAKQSVTKINVKGNEIEMVEELDSTGSERTTYVNGTEMYLEDVEFLPEPIHEVIDRFWFGDVIRELNREL
ncbi:hypothetical protein IMX26_13075 [Clostridium sp. 'deep sea']|uniref:hypothetical protein n=1 Tax=Clostridium sp. 'deep sea' TaxID=2779445 RepID=UPI0018969FE0|nr:hypothetical protein [Clostridium sp. 'deep sea']QOR34418.1 hypothetical protein IMX26_13075 [Clostridium sp. 'deep sea']